MSDSNLVKQVFSKGDKILNPKTNRFVTVGSASWRKLVVEGVVEGAYKGVNSNKPLKKKELNSELGDTDDVPPMPVLIKQPRHKLKKVLPPESDDEDIEELDKKLAEILKKETREVSQKLPKKAGRPKKSKFQTKVIETQPESDDESDA